MKPGYIPKEDIIKELEEIEHNLNELEKRGVELEVKLRKCEEGEMHASVVCFVTPFQSGRAVNLREFLMHVSGTNCVLLCSSSEGDDDTHTDELMVEWFGLIRNKQLAMRRESELVYM